MAGLTEQLQEDTKSTIKDGAKIGNKAMQTVEKGIAFIFNETVLSEEVIMRALNKKVNKTGNLDFSYAKVSMEELQKSGRVESVEEPILKETMRYFDKYCREHGVKYSALKVEPEGDKTGEKQFIIFFEGKNDKIMEHIIKSALSDWAKAQQSTKESERNAGLEKGETKERQSVLAKLAFFRNRVKESVNAENEKGSQKTKQDMVRVPDQER